MPFRHEDYPISLLRLLHLGFEELSKEESDVVELPYKLIQPRSRLPPGNPSLRHHYVHLRAV